MRPLRILAAGILLSLSLVISAQAQQVNNYWFTGTLGQSCPSCWVPVSNNNPIPVAVASGGSSGSPLLVDCSAPNNTLCGDITAPISAGTNRVGYTSDDPCTQKIKTNLPISQNGTSSVQLIALSGSTTIYVCSLSLIAAGATTVVITTGTGTACATNNAAVIGDTTTNVANGLSLAANGGLTLGGGIGTIASSVASGELCMTLGTNVRMSGNLTYVQQ